MNYRDAGLWVLLILVPFSVLITGCPTSGPAAPASLANTPTVTPTACMNASATPSPCTPTTTPSFTPTITPTFTNTPCTCTYTPTLCPTQAPTASPTNTGYSVSGILSRSPATGVNSSNTLGVVLFNPNFAPPRAFVSSSGGSYSITGIPSGVYIPVYWYNTVGDGSALRSPHVGDYVGINGISTCMLLNGTAVTVNGDLMGQNFTVTNARQLYGIAGSVSYTGSLGPVSSCKRITVELFVDGSYATSLGSAQEVLVNGGRYDAIPYQDPAADLCMTRQVYLRAHLNLNGCCTPQSGDPYIQMGPLSTAISAGTNLTLTDSQLWP